MQVRNLFKKPIDRPINGVVKADQLDESTIWQELDEFVVTRELDQHLRKFFSTYAEAVGHPKDADLSGKIGVWVSGFFGSGKSHFIKILSYLLKNEEHHHNGEAKKAVDFFQTKIQDAMLFADVKRAVASNTDVVLFNIDSKADARAGRDAILSVFLKVLNEMQGFCSNYAHIAHMERYLAGIGKLAEFEEVFESLNGKPWRDRRKAYHFSRDHVVQALGKVTGQSVESCVKWIDNAKDHFTLTIENFCKWVKEYLDQKGKNHRIIFLVDEVGQFIGGDTHLMLNLQTITEDLGTVCGGRAWVVVTSQEDIDAVLGDLRTTKSHDFSKIQGRFKTRLSLSSQNCDEVIQERLLKKDDENDQITEWLETTYKEKGDILRNQLSFHNVGTTYKQFTDADTFTRNYPFAPYQFQLIQRVFEAIRKAGATGLHLSRGERSILDAFQLAAQAVADCELGILVPLYRFYPSIDSFLDTAVKRTIDQAKDNPSLKPFDIEILRVLFLIRYVDEMKGNIDNLVTLCIDKIDADRLALKKQIEESLLRLEKQSLIGRSGDNFYFLTHEEQDINREIKTVDLSSSEEAKMLGEVIFDDVLKGTKKYTYQANKKVFDFNRVCDGFPYGNRVDKDLTLQVFTPLGATAEPELWENARFQRDSMADGGQVVIKLDDDPSLERELRQYIQTEKYLRTKSDDGLPETTKRIHRALAEDNRERRERLKNTLEQLLGDAAYFAAGQKVEIKSSTPGGALDESLEYLIDNTFPKMAHIGKFSDEPKKELQAILRANDLQKAAIAGANNRAMEEVRDFITLSDKANHPVVLFDMIEKYGKRPYGWPDDEVLLLVACLHVLGEIQLVMNGAPISIDKVFENVTAPRKQRSITVVRRKMPDPKVLQQCRNLGKEVFSEMGPDSEDGLFEFQKSKCKDWQSALSNYKSLADTGNYPGQAEITDGLNLLKALLAADEPAKFIERFLENKEPLLDLCDEFHDIDQFYRQQRPTWEKLRKAYDRFGLNRMELERDQSAATAMARMKEILSAPSPYKIVHEAEGLISTVEAINTAIVTKRRDEALARINELHSQVIKEVETAHSDEELRRKCLGPLESLRSTVQRQDSVAHIGQAVQEAERALDAALVEIETFLKKKQEKQEKKGGGEPPVVVKPRKEIKPALLVKSPYLETQDDIDGFLDALKNELQQAFNRGERIQIR
ncbi:MAG: BREX system P-loop protein BrxC [Planctomycetes bacterium]|nr:BREX system P-loop protein BrxC [Planctomycetota bacterium]